LVDIHSHVLFGMDDGARTLEESLAMVRMAAEHGTTDLVATPHANIEYRFDPEQIAERLAQIQTAVTSPRIYTGSDFHLTFDNIASAMEHPAKYTINQKCYLLVEFSELMIFHNTGEIFSRLMDGGMIPVITHPERNSLLRQRLDQIAQWVEAGARVQVTGQSLTGKFGRRALDFSRLLLDQRLVHVIASDGHDCERRPPVLDQAYAWLTEHYSKELAETLCVGNPGATLTGEPMALFDEPAEPSRKWYQIWR
jgi:protein-tyrosine phosphatase